MSPESKVYFANQDKIEGIYHLSRNTRDPYRWTAEEWCMLWDAYKASGFDITPCEWSAMQIIEALGRGDAATPKAPQWADDGTPIDGKPLTR